MLHEVIELEFFKSDTYTCDICLYEFKTKIRDFVKCPRCKVICYTKETFLLHNRIKNMIDKKINSGSG